MKISGSSASSLLVIVVLSFQEYAVVDSFSTSSSFSTKTLLPTRHTAPSSFSIINPVITSPTQLYESVSAAAEEESSSGTGTATIPNEIFNLVKGIVGSGVLGLPAGIAAYGNAPSAVLPAIALIALIGFFSAYGFSLIGRVCSYTGGTSYPDAWSKSVSAETSWIIAVSTTIKTMCAVLTYSMILADTGSALATTVGKSLGRTSSLLGITTVLLLPLCWLKDLSSLAPFSLAGIIGMLYTAFAMGARYFGKAYAAVPVAAVAKKGAAVAAAKFVVDPKFTPFFGTKGAASVLDPSAFILICMLSTAYMAHFNAAKFFIELKDNTISRFNTVVSTSFGISVAIFAAIASMGFLTFGGNTAGLILNNYSTRDSLMSLSRIAVAISLVFSYPLAFQGARDGVLELFNIKDRSNKTLNTVTVALLSLVTGVAYKLRDVSMVLAFAGATLGNALIYVFPALMFRGSVNKMKDPKQSLKNEVKFALGSAGLGTVFGIIGLKMAIKSVM